MCTFHTCVAANESSGNNPPNTEPEARLLDDDAVHQPPIASAPSPANKQNAWQWQRLATWLQVTPHLYIIIFGSGVFCSVTLMVLLNGFLPSRQIKAHSHSLPDGHFLQVRDEFNVLARHSEYNFGWDSKTAENAVKGKKKSPRGRFCILY